jgi:hypothetical protein
MSRRKKYWLIGSAVFAAGVVAALYIAGSIVAKRFEPMLREQVIAYLQNRFHADVQLSRIHISPPKTPPIRLLLTRGRGAIVRVEAEGLAMRMKGALDLPPLFSIQKFSFQVDLGSLADERKTVDTVTIQGMQISIPPKGRHPQTSQSTGSAPNVLIRHVRVERALISILPKEREKSPLRFHIAHLRLDSVALGSAMKYDAALTIPKPPGEAHAGGAFGPWNAGEPGDTPLAGRYTFEHANLGVFNGIGGTLASSGDFTGSLSAIQVRGQATIPDFRLEMAGNPVPLFTQFEVLVDGTNGNTILRPVKAKLGSTAFTTTGAVIKHEQERRRAITLEVSMPEGHMRDLLRLASKDPPFLEGRIMLNTRIDIPPLDARVKQKLALEGRFRLREAKFLRARIQDQIDQLSRRGQGQPKNQEIDDVVSNMSGRFRLDDQVLSFSTLSFDAPGAQVQLAGDFDMRRDLLDFHGVLKLAAKVSQTMTGWKRWVLKPADPFFAKHGAGTYLHIKVVGSPDHPQFGLDRGGDDRGEAARRR